ncbi:EAL domain-containing protein [Roseisolibacter sp. H3M3-2]|uniref:putative bifunctional diguanylate cyclase/phosphodiesterase n=1 Tax=Roseisolibacter sp. H3M3-2 TaxID=3031323 RepID=UPI0023DBCAFD|nr:EAL domain-containing protein [Roseisolibacter sp. H3M3-2]MDF1505846.1 EAL domain-containing protein [Roseisolibacter sp. H3M3-2]
MPLSLLPRADDAGSPARAAWDPRIARAGGALLAALWALRFAPGVDHAAVARVVEGTMLPLASVFGVLLWRAATAARLRGDAPSARAWRHVATATCVWWLAGVVWELAGRPAVSLADVIQLAFFPFVLAGVLAFPAPPAARGFRVRFWLDTGVVVLSGAAVVWYWVLWPALTARAAAPLDVLVNCGYPVADLALLYAACAALVRGPDVASRRALAWVAAGLVARFAGDVSMGWQTLTNGYEAGGLTELTWMTATWALATGAAESGRRRGHADGAAPARLEARGLGLLPYVAVAILHAFLLASPASAWGTRASGVLVVAVAVTALVLLRQYVASRELARLQGERGAREAVRASEARFRSLVQHSSDIIALLDAGGTVRYVSPSIERNLGHAAEPLLGTPIRTHVHPDDVALSEVVLAEAARTRGTYGPIVLRLVNTAGEWRTMECLATNLLDDPAVGGIVVNVRDVTERALLQQQLAHQAFHDPLTGLANRTLFRDRVAHALARTGRSRSSVAVLFLDVDDFKTVNDSLGHAAGDRLLAAVGERLLNATRGCDTVARLGGDEFAVLLENAGDGADALTVASRVAAALRAPLVIDGRELMLDASIGVARADLDDGPEELLRNADVAMYRAKHGGKGRTELFAPEMHAALLDRLVLEADLRQALAAGGGDQFTLHFQPIVRLADAEVVGAEALVRWAHPSRGRISPAQFIPIAESSGLIVPLGTWVLREACRAGARWAAGRADAPDATPLTMTVNLSGRQLQAPGLVDEVAAVLAETGLPPSALVLEITETVMMQGTEANLVTLHALRALGVRLAIDDFGTGYSSLSYLQRFPIDILKIDKSFVEGLSRGAHEAALARTILALGDTLALRCIAEGVEDAAQRDHLRALGCDFAQGFLFARPMPEEEMDALVGAGARIGAAA